MENSIMTYPLPTWTETSTEDILIEFIGVDQTF